MVVGRWWLFVCLNSVIKATTTKLLPNVSPPSLPPSPLGKLYLAATPVVVGVGVGCPSCKDEDGDASFNVHSDEETDPRRLSPSASVTKRPRAATRSD